MRLAATPETCFWGYLDALEPGDDRRAGDELTIEAVTHHAGDAPDLMMDDGIRAIWEAIPEADRAPGVHIMTGPIAVTGASPGDTLVVEILEMAPRLPYGSNCAANWGLLYDTFGKERITIYGLTDATARVPADGAAVVRVRLRRPADVRPCPASSPPPDPASRASRSAGRSRWRCARTSA